MSLIISLLLLIPCVVNVSFSVFASVCFRRYPRPPAWVIVFLLILGTGTFRLLFMGGFGYTITLFTAPSAVLCIVLALALMCRWWFGKGLWKSFGVVSVLVLPVVVWADLRFSVLVVDGDGKPVEVDARAIELQAQPAMDFHRGYGNRLKKGVVYFGFCQWVQQREHWAIGGDAVSPEGAMLRRKKIHQKANWGNWPLRITVDPKAP